MKNKFRGYRSLLVVIAIVILILACALTTTTVTDVEIVDNQLVVDESGRVSGQLSWCFTEETEPRFFPPFVTCYLRNVDNASLAKLDVGKQFEISFHTFQFQFLGQRNPHQIFVDQVLNIEPSQIKESRSQGLLTQIFIDG